MVKHWNALVQSSLLEISKSRLDKNVRNSMSIWALVLYVWVFFLVSVLQTSSLTLLIFLSSC